MSFLGKHCFDRCLDSFHTRRVERGLLADTDFPFLQFIENVGFADRVDAGKIDTANQFLFADDEDNNDAAILAVFLIDADVVEKTLGVECLHVSPDHLGTECVSRLRSKVVFDCFTGNPPVPADIDAFDLGLVGRLTHCRL